LGLVQKNAFEFLWIEANPENGLVKDRARNFEEDRTTVASIASVGFALASLPVAVERRWKERGEARERALRTLRYFAEKAKHEKGFFYHFVDIRDGKRVWKSEISSIDSALLLAGAIVVREYFRDVEITRLVNAIYKRMDFHWMLNGGKTLSMGWTPESGFLKDRWFDYNEGILLTLLALGSPTHSISRESWQTIRRRVGIYSGFIVIQSPPLFTHQYPHLFFDFRNKSDDFADYFTNSKNATLANYAYSQNNARKFKTFKKGYWGITASDGPGGYQAYGAEPGGANSDGTVAPTGAITSIMFTPDLSMEFIRNLYNREKYWLWGKYGFTDAFNFDGKWKSPDVIGIDLGALLLGIENYRTGLIWRTFMQAPEIKRALSRAGFGLGTKQLELPKRPAYRVMRKRNITDWQAVPMLELSDPKYLEFGEISGPNDLKATLQFAWDHGYLHFRLIVKDDSIKSTKGGQYIWKNDCLELFIDPKGKGLEWGSRRFFQLGFSPHPNGKQVRIWSWFQKENPTKRKRVKAEIRSFKDGYELKGKIAWSYLRVRPRNNMTLSLTPAFHDMDEDGSETKFTWHFSNVDGKFELGRLILK